MITVGVNGACGRMGLRIINLAVKEDDLELTQVIEHSNHPALGDDFGAMIGIADLHAKVADSLIQGEKLDVLIDFSSASATMQRVKECRENGTGIVIGTTGLSSAETNEVELAARDIPCLMAPNMSVGVNLLFDVVEQVARALGNEPDVEIVETHHRFKKDAPSGTALRIAERICGVTDRDMGNDAVYGRHGQVGERKKNEIGIHAVRSGNTIGIHKVIFDCDDECIEITHSAHSRDAFASGSLKAARFVAGQKPGLYSMDDVLKGR